ncbi:hypothetical protein RHMOL_Rhmol09G0155400 [Rhododendron molle]|uniref:Uncharacterized protein n=1 Tax=Rhododendron molle TaxID=49168 RepID=A0ACC0MFH8_RHOML|nr:hypothetical protein RHMOL_Rhmol09G0155400 [Rhododendron molle]
MNTIINKRFKPDCMVYSVALSIRFTEVVYSTTTATEGRENSLGSSEHPTPDSEGIACMRAACELAALVLNSGRKLV